MFKTALAIFLLTATVSHAQDKLFLVIYKSNAVTGSVGPLAGTMEMCNKEKVEFDSDKLRFLLVGVTVDGVPATPEQIAEARAMEFVCEIRNERPKIGEPKK